MDINAAVSFYDPDLYNDIVIFASALQLAPFLINHLTYSHQTWYTFPS